MKRAGKGAGKGKTQKKRRDAPEVPAPKPTCPKQATLLYATSLKLTRGSRTSVQFAVGPPGILQVTTAQLPAAQRHPAARDYQEPEPDADTAPRPRAATSPATPPQENAPVQRPIVEKTSTWKERLATVMRNTFGIETAVPEAPQQPQQGLRPPSQLILPVATPQLSHIVKQGVTHESAQTLMQDLQDPHGHGPLSNISTRHGQHVGSLTPVAQPHKGVHLTLVAQSHCQDAGRQRAARSIDTHGLPGELATDSLMQKQAPLWPLSDLDMFPHEAHINVRERARLISQQEPVAGQHTVEQHLQVDTPWMQDDNWWQMEPLTNHKRAHSHSPPHFGRSRNTPPAFTTTCAHTGTTRLDFTTAQMQAVSPQTHTQHHHPDMLNSPSILTPSPVRQGLLSTVSTALPHMMLGKALARPSSCPMTAMYDEDEDDFHDADIDPILMSAHPPDRHRDMRCQPRHRNRTGHVKSVTWADHDDQQQLTWEMPTLDTTTTGPGQESADDIAFHHQGLWLGGAPFMAHCHDLLSPTSSSPPAHQHLLGHPSSIKHLDIPTSAQVCTSDMIAPSITWLEGSTGLSSEDRARSPRQQMHVTAAALTFTDKDEVGFHTHGQGDSMSVDAPGIGDSWSLVQRQWMLPDAGSPPRTVNVLGTVHARAGSQIYSLHDCV